MANVVVTTDSYKRCSIKAYILRYQHTIQMVFYYLFADLIKQLTNLNHLILTAISYYQSFLDSR